MRGQGGLYPGDDDEEEEDVQDTVEEEDAKEEEEDEGDYDDIDQEGLDSDAYSQENP